MNFEQIFTLVLSSIGTAGGAAAIIKLISTIVKTSSDRKLAKALEANTKAKKEQTEELKKVLKEELNVSLDVDLSAKINPMVESIREEFVYNTETQAKELYALKELICANTKILSRSNKLNADEKESINNLVLNCEGVIGRPADKGVLKVVLNAAETVKEVAEAIAPIAQV